MSIDTLAETRSLQPCPDDQNPSVEAQWREYDIACMEGDSPVASLAVMTEHQFSRSIRQIQPVLRDTQGMSPADFDRTISRLDSLALAAAH